MIKSRIHLILMIVCAPLLELSFGRMDCAQLNFKGGSTKTGKVHCGAGFHECGSYGEACCNDVKASPIQLTMVILGPAALLCSAALMIFVIRSVARVVSEEKQNIQLEVYHDD